MFRILLASYEGQFVIKPLVGSQGRDVFFLSKPDATNTRQVVDILGRTGYLVVQEYMPEATEGDIRVLTLGDSIVNANEKYYGIRRTPADGEMRSNVSLGGTPEVIELSEKQVAICHEVASYLSKDGISFAGIDLIGDRIVEVNVFSPSGLQEFNGFTGADISGSVAAYLIEGDSQQDGLNKMLRWFGTTCWRGDGRQAGSIPHAAGKLEAYPTWRMLPACDPCLNLNLRLPYVASRIDNR